MTVGDRIAREIEGETLVRRRLSAGIMVCLRSATTADDHAMAAVHREAIRGIGSGEDRVDEYTADELDAWASAQDSERYPFEDESQYLAVAEREEAECDPRRSEADADSRVVGFVGVDLGAGVLETLYVRPEAAGEGVGTTLLDHAERVAREDGHDELLTGASLNAVGFYERHGYETEEMVEKELPDATVAFVKMRTSLVE